MGMNTRNDVWYEFVYRQMNNKCKEDVLLLTACVQPNGMSNTVLQDPRIRESQYLDAINYYLLHTKYRIVVVENSNYDFSTKITDKTRVEFLTFDGNQYDKKLGKGYGEGLILKYALFHSRFISKNTRVVKITGRLIVTNINQLLFLHRGRNSIYANNEKVNNKMRCITKVVIYPYKFLTDYFIPESVRINDSSYHYFEHITYECARKWKCDGTGRFSEFWLPIKIIGISGTSGKTLSSDVNIKTYFSLIIRNIFHLFSRYSNYTEILNG